MFQEVAPLPEAGMKRSLSPEKEVLPASKKAREDGQSPSHLLVCFDLEMTDGSFASEIFQVSPAILCIVLYLCMFAH